MLEKKLKQIENADLRIGGWYLGRGRNSNIGYWNGTNFLTIGFKFNSPVIKIEPYYEKKKGCFQPFMLIKECMITEPFGKTGWKKHYGKTLRLILD